MFDYKNEILTTDDVCEELYASRNTVYSLLRSGKLKGFQLGRTWKIPESALEDYIKSEV